jgi:hypothetical protein
MATELGNLIGGSAHLGACFKCRKQFMSTHDMAARRPSGVIVCARCDAEGRTTPAVATEEGAGDADEGGARPIGKCSNGHPVYTREGYCGRCRP